MSSRSVGDTVVTAINEGTILWAPELTAPEAEWRAAILEADEEGRHRFQDGSPVPRFPHAQILLGRGEWESQPLEEADETDFVVRSALWESGLLELVDGDREVMPGLWMLHAPGESPGHSIVRLRSDGETFYALGDLCHHACEIEHPDWAVPWAELVTMRASRDRFMAEMADAGALVAFSHEPFPPWGRIVHTGSGYRWERG